MPTNSIDERRTSDALLPIRIQPITPPAAAAVAAAAIAARLDLVVVHRVVAVRDRSGNLLIAAALHSRTPFVCRDTFLFAFTPRTRPLVIYSVVFCLNACTGN